MKLSFKIALAVVVIVAISVCVSGYVLIGTGFRSQLDRQITQAADENQMFCAALGTLALRRTVMEQSVEEALRQELKEESFVRDRQLELLDGAALPDGSAAFRIDRERDGRAILTVTTRFSVEGETFCLRSRTDVTDGYTLRRQNLRTYRVVLLTAAVLSLAAGWALGRFMTAPIRKLSRSAGRIAAGEYRCRADVRTGDEIGALAQRFNTMADALETHMTELEQSARQQREFTAAFAHELKTPLTSIIGYADTMRSRKLPEEQQLKAETFIFTEGKRLETMSRSLLRLFALEQEKPALRRLLAQSLGQAAARSTRYALEQKKMTLEVSMAPAVVLGESALLETLLVNLIDNARKASGEGQTLWLTGTSTAEGYRISVRDRGRGIPAEALNRLTEPFFMVDKSRSRAEGGAGLGLALGQKIAECHGTTLTYVSVPGQGTEVSFVLREET